MFRAAIHVSIVLALLAGPVTGAWCRAICGPSPAATNGCHHDDDRSSPTLGASPDCGGLPGGAVLIGERTWRASPDRNAPLVDVISTSGRVAPISGAGLASEAGRASPLGPPRISSILRI